MLWNATSGAPDLAWEFLLRTVAFDTEQSPRIAILLRKNRNRLRLPGIAATIGDSSGTLYRSTMNTPLRRIRRGAIVLVSIFVFAVLGYRFFGDYDWIHAVWMVVVTISSVGYGEHSELPSHLQMLSVVVILLGMSASLYTVGGFIQLMLEGEIQAALGQSRTTREIQRLSGHVIVCGFGRIGEMLAEDLRRKGRSLVVIDTDPARVSEADQRQFLAINGDAMEEDALVGAGLKRAGTVVTVLPNDAANVFITLTARDFNSEIQIIARAEHPSTEKKLRQAGANRVVMPAVTGATQMSRIITRPSTAHLLELLAESGFNDVEMDEITINSSSRLVGSNVTENATRQKHGVLVLAVKPQDGSMVFNPGARYTFRDQDTVIVMGDVDDIESFRQQCGTTPKASGS